MRYLAPFLVLCLAALGTTGCGQSADRRVPVSGIVRIDGQPLTTGTIRFVPESGRPASSAIMADGSFDLASDRVNQISEPGVLVGTYQVQVSANRIIDDETIHWYAPAKYADFRTAGLDLTIDRPTDDLAIDLTWGDEKPPAANEDEGADEQAVTVDGRADESNETDVESGSAANGVEPSASSKDEQGSSEAVNNE